MDAVDATTHYEIYATEETPSLTAIVIDTNPRAWAAINNVLPISKALANILVFVNSQLAYSSSNQVAIIASHTNRAVWLWPTPPKTPKPFEAHQNGNGNGNGGDVEMADADSARQQSQKLSSSSRRRAAANKFAQFAQIESAILTSLRDLITSTTDVDLAATTTQISGALTLALHHANKTSLQLTDADGAQAASGSAKANGGATAGNPAPGGGAGAAISAGSGALRGLHARILVLSVSDSSPAQYIPTMNAVFAASHAGIPIDILSLHGSPTFLQQASYITRGTFLEATSPQGLLQYLMFGFASAIDSRQTVTTTTTGAGQAGTRAAIDGATGLEQLVSPSTTNVDFRAACFCHRRVIDTGFVCSICLSIFCEVPEDATCYTCGNKLALGRYGAKPAVVPRRKKKKRKLGLNGEPVGTSEQPSSVAGTPRSG
ncbi:TFIIH subunit Tfb4/p34 [Coniella lustricola]|uniref:General transcription and DNA repair factor IIH subunit TFB4 n=1 Tax=Coniella lustricola TaxID=2025994 RepID=A0A2T3A854_9PEZI|nr:TFIIH subunit Tfb4/p34 [Coniella lustricola]